MTLITLLVAIALTAIMLSLQGFAPYVRAFVGVAKYPAYAYFAWQYAPSVLRHLLLVDAISVRLARFSQVWHSGRRLITPRSLFSAALALSFWLLQTVVTRVCLCASSLAVSRIPAGRWDKFIVVVFSVRLSVQAHLHQYLVEPCSLFASSFWSCALTHVMTCIVTHGFDFIIPASVWLTISRYPISLFVGLLGLIIMWRCALKTIVLGLLGIDVLAYAYLSVISSLARMLLSLRLGDWVVLVLSLKYVFDVKYIPRHEVAQIVKYTVIALVLREDILAQRLSELRSFVRRAVRECAPLPVRLFKYLCIALVRLSVRLIVSGLYLVLRQAGRLLFKHMLVHVVRPLVFIIFYSTCVTCVMGCVLAATIVIELFAAIVVPLYRRYSLVHLQYKPGKDITSVIERRTPPSEPSRPPSVPSETCLSTLPTSPNPSRSATSDGVGRLARFINAYLDESVSSESVVELENPSEPTGRLPTSAIRVEGQGGWSTRASRSIIDKSTGALDGRGDEVIDAPRGHQRLRHKGCGPRVRPVS
ncbi:hypothetical protein RhiJN_09242 [Ceratobasidium sp. AG-Ba]|nr:hypothetical protein RhiJN_09242 [Ceratobasidium sp. AG-Ba]QRW10001.1 hypothetical protein RhiLY_09000 [Ceratobasidium sp. AG-Ba]